jgi:hypothetical protein
LDVRRLLARPLGAPERARALGVAALVLTGWVVWLAQRGPILEEARPVPTETTASASATAPERGAPRRVARAFLAAFLPYGYGVSPTPPRPELLTPALRAELAGSAPSAPDPTPTRLRLVSLVAETLEGGRARVVAGIDDGREAYPLTLDLVHTDRWRVAAVGH